MDMELTIPCLWCFHFWGSKFQILREGGGEKGAHQNNNHLKDLPYLNNWFSLSVEAQFNVLKDSVLKRTKEVNINGLLTKIIEDFNDHYVTKLSTLASSGVCQASHNIQYNKFSKIYYILYVQMEIEFILKITLLPRLTVPPA